jgi:N-acetylglucosaminyldiphosphoundecaprenol N-acetyl-beta-D-mannosaminyltransferase
MELFGYRIDRLNLSDAVTRVIELAKTSGFKTVTTLNAMMVAEADRQPWLNEYIRRSELVVADGSGITLALKLMMGESVEKVAGVDLVAALLCQDKVSLFLIGGTPLAHDDMMSDIKRRFNKARIVGTSHGYFGPEDKKKLMVRVSETSPDVILVGMGVPLQERFINDLRGQLSHGVAIGVGGSFDVVSGKLERAPRWVVDCHLEWAFRGIKQPFRMKKWGLLGRFMIMMVLRK